MSRQRVVIVGAGLAGAKAAEALRDRGFDGTITLVGTEAHHPYERPPLSKEHLLGTASDEKIFVHEDGWYAEHDVDLRLGTTIRSLDRDAHEVVTDDGGRLGYDHLLLTTGSSPRRLTVPGADLDGVLYLRTLDDNARIKSAFVADARVVVVGGGWIGLETAAAARAAGAHVTILEQAELPLLRVLGPKIAQVFADLHRDHGVDLRTSAEVASLREGSAGTVGAVVLADGTEIGADAVVVGVGITPNVDLAAAAGIDVDDGVVVDEHLRSSDPDVYAAGDVASAYHPGLHRHLRVEHWANALNQPAVAADAITGGPSVYDRLPYFFSDQYDLGMEYVGFVAPGATTEVVVRGDLAGREFVAFWLQDGKVAAGMNVNVWDVTDPIKALIGSGSEVDAGRLADPEVPLEDLV